MDDVLSLNSLKKKIFDFKKFNKLFFKNYQNIPKVLFLLLYINDKIILSPSLYF